MKEFIMSKMRNNPRIIVTVSEHGAYCKGVYIDSRENTNSFNRQYDNENQALDYLNNMRDNANCEFSIQVNRINWSK
jgi:hypothetical protein